MIHSETWAKSNKNQQLFWRYLKKLKSFQEMLFKQEIWPMTMMQESHEEISIKYYKHLN